MGERLDEALQNREPYELRRPASRNVRNGGYWILSSRLVYLNFRSMALSRLRFMNNQVLVYLVIPPLALGVVGSEAYPKRD